MTRNKLHKVFRAKCRSLIEDENKCRLDMNKKSETFAWPTLARGGAGLLGSFCAQKKRPKGFWVSLFALLRVCFTGLILPTTRYSYPPPFSAHPAQSHPDFHFDQKGVRILYSAHAEPVMHITATKYLQSRQVPYVNSKVKVSLLCGHAMISRSTSEFRV